MSVSFLLANTFVLNMYSIVESMDISWRLQTQDDKRSTKNTMLPTEFVLQ